MRWLPAFPVILQAFGGGMMANAGGK